jgi:hypothetical protein
VITSRAFDIKERSGPAVLHDVRHAVLNVLREDTSERAQVRGPFRSWKRPRLLTALLTPISMPLR